MQVAVHDLMIREKGQSNQDVFNNTKKLVKTLDELRYDRYWFAEHHGFENLLSVAPEIVASYFLAETKNITIGTGGTMIMHYSPLKVAETFKTLAELAPGRVDLGIGRAPGTGMPEIRALNTKFGSKDPYLYPEIETILAYLSDENPRDPIYRNVKAVPTKNENLANPWMLGSTGVSAERAAEYGLPYSFAKFFAVPTSAQIFKDYRQNFKPSVFADKPFVSVSYKMLISDDKDELEYLGKSFDYFHIQQAKNETSSLVDPEEVKDYEFTDRELGLLNKSYENRFIIKGSKEEVAEILNDEIKEYGIDEIMCFTPIYGVDNRINTYKALKEIFD